MWILKLREVHVTLLSVRNIDLHVMNHGKCFVVFIIYSTVNFLILEVFVYCCWLFCPFVFMSAAFFFESAICNTWLFWEYLINICKNKSAYLCVNIYLLSMIPKNCLSFMYKEQRRTKTIFILSGYNKFWFSHLGIPPIVTSQRSDFYCQ